MGSYSIRNVGIVNALDRAEKDMQFLKNLQYVGSRVLQTKVSVADELAESVDLNTPGTGTVVAQIVYKNVTFVADSQLSPHGRLTMEFFGPDKVTRLGDGSGINILTYNFTVTHIDDSTLKWNVDIRGPASPRFYVRFSVAGTDTGQITWVNAWEDL